MGELGSVYLGADGIGRVYLGTDIVYNDPEFFNDWTWSSDFATTLPDSDGWTLTGLNTQRSLGSGKLNIVDASTAGGSLCNFKRSVNSTGPCTLEATLSVASASTSAYAVYMQLSSHGVKVDVCFTATRIYWIGGGSVDFALDMTTPHKIELHKIEANYFVLMVDGEVLTHGGGAASVGVNQVLFGGGSSTATSNSSWSSVRFRNDIARPRIAAITSYPAVTAGTQIATGGHNSFGMAIRTTAGNIVAVWRYALDHNATNGVIRMSTSSDEGVTWSSPATIVDTAFDCRDPNIGYANGKLVLCYVDADGTDRSVYMTTSDDEGATWSTATLVDTGFTDWSFTGGQMVSLGSTWYLPVYGTDDGTTWGIRVLSSTDEGATWDIEADPTPAVSGKQYAEPVMARFDGYWVIAYRSESESCIYFKRSVDASGPWVATGFTVAQLGRPAMSVHNGTLWLLNRTTNEVSYSFDGVRWITGRLNALPSGGTYNYGSIVPLDSGAALIVWARETLSTAATVETTKLDPFRV